jgi:hypothetical protein
MVQPAPPVPVSTPIRPDDGGARTARGPLGAALALAAALCALATADLVRSRANLLHYDAKAHLLVARRVLDSLTPGWFQLGAVWLPLPHVLNMLPAQSDALYASGAAGSAIGCAAFLLGAAGLALAAARATRDSWAGVVALAVVVGNPGWLYVQGTPLSEPVFLGPLGLLALFLVRWRQDGRPRDLHLAALCAALACLARYEAWPIVALCAPLTLRHGLRGWTAAARFLGLGLVLPLAYFGFHSWMADGIVFYVMPAYHLTEDRAPLGRALGILLKATAEGLGWPLLAATALAWVALAVRRGVLLPLSLACAAGAWVTLTAYLAGHPSYARYALLLSPVPALALAGATRGRRAAQAAALAVAVTQGLAVGTPAPAVAEATRWIHFGEQRRPAINAFRCAYRGGRLLAAMAATGHVLYELQIPVREVVFENNKQLWRRALGSPRGVASWVLVTEGDTIDRVRRQDPTLLEGYLPFATFRRSVLYRAAQGASAPSDANSVPSAQPTSAAPKATPANSSPDSSSGRPVSTPLNTPTPSRAATDSAQDTGRASRSSPAR